MSPVAIAAMRDAEDYLQQAGPFSNAVNAWINREVSKIRGTIAAELGTTPNTIAFTENVSAGCNIALWGWDWQAEDHILLSDCEHPSVIATVQELQHRFGVKSSTFPLLATLNQGDPVAVLGEHLRPNTRLVVVSHLLWNTGQVLPLKEMVTLCHQQVTRGEPIRVLVDAAQSVGSLPLNLSDLGADFYAFTGHKWWCGPAGVGGLYIHPDAIAVLRPTFIGWRGITSDAQGNPTGWVESAKRYEVATSAYSLYLGLQAAIATHQAWGSAEVRYQQICHLSKILWQQLSELPQIHCLKSSPPEAGLVSFQLAGYDQHPYGQLHQRLVQFLEDQKIMVRTLKHPDCVRAGVHYFTTISEIEHLIAAIQDFEP